MPDVSPPFNLAPCVSRSSYTLGWFVDLVDPHALWEAAAAVLSAVTGMMPEHVVETLGPREDPNIVDCLIALLPRISIPGCEASILCSDKSDS
ncbi:MAG: hypothetical protein EOO38_19815 [Cytophagaceae bacterium]|nr:MAG: hypothetical protein EOO38_19815 [Cytophagaceae bacterium]